MSALSEKVAAEHILYRCTEDAGTGVFGQPVEVYVGVECECGWTAKDSAATSQHIADITERAVRDTVAESIEADMNHDANRNATLATAARIAREGTTPA